MLRNTPDGPHLPPRPLPLPHGERKGERGVLARKNIATSQMVAQARYAPDEKSGFLIGLSERDQKN